ncbi:MAG: preprotein translocase subunit SecY [Candidatus Bathyarchaeota archaeon]|nr:preprotein translocase subunit SecY [Candidatus Bathyarchaeota archaeon]
MAGRFLRVFQPLIRFIPEIKAPERRVSFTEKLVWTSLALLIYFIMSEIPLYGLSKTEDILFYRVIFASTRGTLMELGIGPIVTAGLILQLLAASGFIGVDFSDPEDRALFTGANKVLSVIMTVVQASAYLLGGFFGRLEALQAAIIFIQLIIAGIIIMLLDEMIQKGWGLGSGISLFILAGVAQRIILDCFSIWPSLSEPGKARGIIPAMIQTLAAGESLNKLFIRPADDPSILSLILTIGIFLFCIYAQGVRVEIPIAHSQFRGFRGKYPISLLYVSNLPVIFASALFGNIYVIGQILWNNYRNNSALYPWIKLIGDFEYGEGEYLRPVGGLAYYVTAPSGFVDVLEDPLRYSVYAILLIIFCLIFSWVWLQVGGLDPRTVAKQLVDSGMQVPGFRRSEKPIEVVLKRYIPIVTLLGGFIVGLMAAIADLFGAFGTGTGILLSVGIIYQYYQQIMSERIEEIYPGIRKFLGR